jgi:hypothetical protein
LVSCQGELTSSGPLSSATETLQIQELSAGLVRGLYTTDAVAIAFVSSIARDGAFDLLFKEAPTGTELIHLSGTSGNTDIAMRYMGRPVDLSRGGQSAPELIELLRGPLATSLAELGRIMSDRAPEVLATEAGRWLGLYSLQIEETLGLAQNMTDEELLMTDTMGVEAVEELHYLPSSWRCPGTCGNYCPGDPGWLNLCWADYLFTNYSGESQTNCYDWYCWHHDHCCYHWGAFACLTSCLAFPVINPPH